jgi:hypothetical protein
MFKGLLATLLATSSSEFSPKYSLAFETGVLERSDPHWDIVNPWQSSTLGLRGGYNLSSKLAVVASYQRSSSSSELADSYDYYYDDYGNYIENSSSLEALQSGITENIITVGPKLSLASQKWVVPYVTTQAIIAHGRLEMGDTLSEEDATTYLNDSAMAVGALGALGLEMKTKPFKGKAQGLMYLEYGGGVTSNLNFNVPEIGVDGDNVSIGDLQYAGAHFRFGIGAQF